MPRPAARAFCSVLPFLVAFGATMASAGLAQARYTGRLCASCASFEVSAAAGGEPALRELPPPAARAYHLSAEALVLAELEGPTPIAKDAPAPAARPAAASPAAARPAVAPALACQCDFIPLASEAPPGAAQPEAAPAAEAAPAKKPAAAAAAAKGKGFRETMEANDEEAAPAAGRTENLMAYHADAEDRKEDADDRRENEAEDKIERAFSG